MIRYAITDGHVLNSGGSGVLWEQTERWGAAGIDYIQLREKDLSPAGLAKLARGVLKSIEGTDTKLLLNGRADVAVAIGAHGVHLTSASGEMSPDMVRAVYYAAGLPRPIVSASAHSTTEVQRAVDGRADFILFGPVFGKLVAGEELGRRLGLDALRSACETARTTHESKVLALGGVTHENTPSALEAGAAGIAGIRIFASLKPEADWIPPVKGIPKSRIREAQ